MLSRKRNRSGEDEPASHNLVKHRRKQQPECFAEDTVDETTGQKVANGVDENEVSPVHYWVQKGHWPRKYFQNQNDVINSRYARRRLVLSPQETTIGTPSDQMSRDEKNAPYRTPDYEKELETKGSFMTESTVGITRESKSLVETLLSTDQSIHNESLFRDDLFDKTCENLASRNEIRVMMDIMRLIVPSAEILDAYGIPGLNCLVESNNQGWNNSIPFCGPRPQPDYSVGFDQSAFTGEQLERLEPFIGDWRDISSFMATSDMHFPFLTCEVKSNGVPLDIANRQNAHSMTLAVRGVVELYRRVGRERELHREILAFSISHDSREVQIYGHYALIEGAKTFYYRHPICSLLIAYLDGKDKWTAYKFVRNVYETFMPTHLKRIREAIDQLPSPASGVSQPPQQPNAEVVPEAESNAKFLPPSWVDEDDSQSSLSSLSESEY